MTIRTFVALVGGALIIIGVIMLGVRVHVTVGTESVSCGTATSANNDNVDLADLTYRLHQGPYRDPGEGGSGVMAMCDSARSGQLTWVLVLGFLGVVALAAAAFVRRPTTASST
jgi:hypothetical protein